jgi:hypothetical protein
MRFDENYNVIRDWRGDLKKDDTSQNGQSESSEGGQPESSDQSGESQGQGGQSQEGGSNGAPQSEQLQARASAPSTGKNKQQKVQEKDHKAKAEDYTRYSSLENKIEDKMDGQCVPRELRASSLQSYRSVDIFLDETPDVKAHLDQQLQSFEEQTDPYNVHKQHRTVHGTLDTTGWQLLNERSKHNKLQRSFIQVVEKLAEDLVGYPYVGDDEWDIERIMMRSITREEIQHCRQTRDREALVLMLDTSGSCSEQATMYSKFAEIAQHYSDVDIVIAPNALPSMVKYGHKDEWEKYNRMDLVRESDEHKYGWVLDWPLKERTIIFFGDLDGSDWVIRASWRNNVYWFNSETRRVGYNGSMERARRRIQAEASYQAVEYPLNMFRGKRIDDVTNNDKFLKAARRVRI